MTQLNLNSTFFRHNRARLRQEAAIGIDMLMAKHSTVRSQADLARVLGKKPSQINRMLKGDQNLGLDSLADVYAALGRAVSFRFHDIFHRFNYPKDELENRPVKPASSGAYDTIDFSQPDISRQQAVRMSTCSSSI